MTRIRDKSQWSDKGCPWLGDEGGRRLRDEGGRRLRDEGSRRQWMNKGGSRCMKEARCWWTRGGYSWFRGTAPPFLNPRLEFQFVGMQGVRFASEAREQFEKKGIKVLLTEESFLKFGGRYLIINSGLQQHIRS